MQTLIALSNISTYRPKSGPLADLFQLKEKGASRKEAIHYFKQKGRNKTYLNTIINRLKCKLRDGVISYHFNDYTEYVKERAETNNRVSISLRMIHSGNKIHGVPEAEKTMAKCIELGMSGEAFILCLELLNYYPLANVGASKYRECYNLSERLQKEINLEADLRRLWSDTVFRLHKKISIAPIINELDSFKPRMPGMLFRSNLFYYSIQNLIHRYFKDTEKIILTCRTAAEHFNGYKTPLPFTTTWNFKRQMIPILIAQGRVGEAEHAAKQCRDLCTPGNYNWHVSLIYLALTGFHSGKPAIALQAWKESQSVRKKFNGSQGIRDKWLLIRSYLMLYKKMGRIVLDEKFKMYRFLNSVTSLHRDKAGSNVAVITVELLHLWLDGKKEKFGDRAKRLNNYIYRHLGDSQAKYFFKLLEKRYDAEYNGRAAAQIPGLLEKVNSYETLVSANVFETNVIPPGMAFDMIYKQ